MSVDDMRSSELSNRHNPSSLSWRSPPSSLPSTSNSLVSNASQSSLRTERGCDFGDALPVARPRPSRAKPNQHVRRQEITTPEPHNDNQQCFLLTQAIRPSCRGAGHSVLFVIHRIVLASTHLRNSIRKETTKWDVWREQLSNKTPGQTECGFLVVLTTQKITLVLLRPTVAWTGHVVSCVVSCRREGILLVFNEKTNISMCVEYSS